MKNKQIIFMTLLTIMLVFGMSNASAQVGIGIGSSSVNASAALEVSSTTKGFLPPRMTTSQRNTMGSPADGLIIYNTDSAKMQVRENGLWVEYVTKRGIESGKVLPRARVSYCNNTNVVLVSFPASGVALWDGTTTSTTNWLALSMPAVGSSIVANTQLDSNILMPLGARVNHVNTNGTTGQPMIVYKSDGKNRIIDISAAGSLELPSSGSAPRNIVVALFKTSAAGTTTLIRESVCVIRFNSSVPKTSFSLNAITRVYGGDRFEIRMAQFGSSYAAIDVKFRDLNFSAVAP